MRDHVQAEERRKASAKVRRTLDCTEAIQSSPERRASLPVADT